MVDQAAPEAVKLPDPNDPRYAAARAKMANLLFAIGREDNRNGYGAMADDLMCGDLMQVPTWIALGMLAEAASLPCKSGEGVDLAVWCAREAEARRAEENSSPHTAKLTREGRYDDQGVMPVAIAAARIALGLSTPEASQTREAELVAALEDRAQVACDAECNGDLGVHEAGCIDATAALNARGGA